MITSRRAFLAALAAALTLDPERALWAPGKRLISVPVPAPPVVVYEVHTILILWRDIEAELEATAIGGLLPPPYPQGYGWIGGRSTEARDDS